MGLRIAATADRRDRPPTRQGSILMMRVFWMAFTQFIGAALKVGNAVIVVATESHRDRLLPRLQAHGLDIGAAIEQGRYISLDAADTLSTFMVNDQPDPVRFSKVAGDLIVGSGQGCEGRASPRCSLRRMCASPVGAR